MDYPDELKTNGRSDLDSSNFEDTDIFYMRVPPTEYRDEEDGWIYSSLKSDQSFNWSKFSLPHWVRFDVSKNYNLDRFVIGFELLYLKNASNLDATLDSDSWKLIHKSNPDNYSHCEAHIKEEIQENKQKKKKLKALLAMKKIIILEKNNEEFVSNDLEFYSNLMKYPPLSP